MIIMVAVLVLLVEVLVAAGKTDALQVVWRHEARNAYARARSLPFASPLVERYVCGTCGLLKHMCMYAGKQAGDCDI